MASFTLETRQGPQEFTVQGQNGYVRLNGQQICERGQLRGSALTCSEADLEKVARKWWRDSLRSERSHWI